MEFPLWPSVPHRTFSVSYICITDFSLLHLLLYLDQESSLHLDVQLEALCIMPSLRLLFKKHLRAAVSLSTWLLAAPCLHTCSSLLHNHTGDRSCAVLHSCCTTSMQRMSITLHTGWCLPARKERKYREQRDEEIKTDFAVFASWFLPGPSHPLCLLPPAAAWTWHRWPVCEVRGKNCPASTRSCLGTCRMCLTPPGTWPSTATSWAARACSRPSSHCSRWSRRTSPSYTKVGRRYSLRRATQIWVLLVSLSKASSVLISVSLFSFTSPTVSLLSYFKVSHRVRSRLPTQTSSQSFSCKDTAMFRIRKDTIRTLF